MHDLLRFKRASGARLVLAAVLTLAGGTVSADPAREQTLEDAAARAARTLKERHGASQAARIERGTDQVLRYWRPEDGSAAALAEFLEGEFIPSGAALDATFERLEFALERVAGYLNSLGRDLNRGTDLEIGPLLPLDRRLAAWNVGAHVQDDLFRNKLAFVVLLNFPLTTLEQRNREGLGWSRRQWAEARLASRFSQRLPADVQARLAEVYAAASTYIDNYNVFMHHVLTADGRRLFRPGLRLISHWNLRDELKAGYADPEGLARQRLIQKVMEAIVRQEIPAAVIDNPLLDWTPETGAVQVSPEKDVEAPSGAATTPDTAREADERYRHWLEIFRAERLADAHSPDFPTLMDRRFNLYREIPETEVEALFKSILESPLAAPVARLIATRLGRPLEPFDLWYSGFTPRSRHDGDALDEHTRKRYPTSAAYAADMPRLLHELGFSEARARFLAEHIEVEPSRGAGHAMGPLRRDDKAHLRTRVAAGGMDYKGYNIAVHEMGHNVEQVFSTTTIDHTLLQGVPNTAFTEALAFVFQGRDLELLGLALEDPAASSLHTLNTFWGTREIAAVALVDMAAWRWLYGHPQATPAEFRAALVRIAGDVWTRYFAPLLGGENTVLLGIYSHMVAYGLYTPDYPLGHLIAFQVEKHFESLEGPMGEEFERICRLGSITPDAWMRQAVGAPLSAEPLLQATGGALKVVQEGKPDNGD